MLGNFDLFSILILLVVLFFSASIHEFAHAWMANFLGDPTAKLEGRLTINPIAHIDPMMSLLLPFLLIIMHSPIIFAAAKPVPFNPYYLRDKKWGPPLVALAGPASNLFLILVFAIPLWIFHLFNIALPVFFPSIFILIIFINIILLVINLIPIPPLDGSKILYVILPEEVKPALAQFEYMGFFFVILVLFLFGSAISSIIFSLIGIFVPPKFLPLM